MIFDPRFQAHTSEIIISVQIDIKLCFVQQVTSLSVFICLSTCVCNFLVKMLANTKGSSKFLFYPILPTLVDCGWSAKNN